MFFPCINNLNPIRIETLHNSQQESFHPVSDKVQNAGWNTYFWLSFLPLILLVMVGAKLENIINSLMLDVSEKRSREQESERTIKPSDELFWFHRPSIVLSLIHFILFQNSFEIAFFFWILFTYGIKSCIMERLGFLIPRLVMGVLVQVLCSYSTLPLYALVTQMGSKFKKGIFDELVHSALDLWVEDTRNKGESTTETRRMQTHQTPHDGNVVRQLTFDVEVIPNP